MRKGPRRSRYLQGGLVVADPRTWELTWGEDGVANVRGKRDECRVVVLEERARLVIEEKVANPFPDCCFVIRDADVSVFVPQLCRRRR